MTISGISPGLGVPPGTHATPSQAPAGTPPALWTMLSRAERLFFEVPEGTGVLGYGPAGRATEVAPVLGQHLDVRA